MARSTYIYYAQRMDDPVDGPEVAAAFTVKHELITWLSKEGRRGRYNIWRMSDGAHARPVGIVV